MNETKSSPQEKVESKNTAMVDVTQPSSYLDPRQWAHMKSMAIDFKRSNALPTSDNEYTILMKLQAGVEMGMKPIESIKSFYFVNGSINIFGAATMRRLREHGWSINYKDELDKCTITVKKENEEYSDSLTFKEAELSGWTKDKYGNLKPGWKQGINRKLKLRYGCASSLIKTYLPEVLGSATDIAEIAMDYNMDPVEAEIVVPEGGDPATPKQIETLNAMGIEVPSDLTKAQAVDLLTSRKSIKVSKEEE